MKGNVRTGSKKAAGKAKGRFALISLIPLYAFTLFFIVGPLLYLLYLSFASKGGGILEIDSTLTFKNYKRLFETTYLSVFASSFSVALKSTAIIALVGYPFGYFMAKMEKKKQQRIMTLLTLPFSTNSLIRLIGWQIFFHETGVLDKILMGVGIIKEPLGFLGTEAIIIFGMLYALLPFMIFATYTSVEKMDWTLVEAARDLGASPRRAFFTISLKLTLPGLLSGVILTFIPAIGLYFISDFFGSGKFNNIGKTIFNQMTSSHDIPFAAALAVVLTLLTTLMIKLYKVITKTDKVEGLV